MGRSVLAIVAGFFVVVILSLGIDEVLHLLKVYPPWGEPMYDPGLNALALSYRIVVTVFSGYVTARLAPRNPMKHVLVGATLGLVLGTVAAIASIRVGGLGPNWYPIAIAVTGFPSVYLGGMLDARSSRGRTA
jgi:hypothetical protein